MENDPNHLREFAGFRLDAERRVLWFRDAVVNIAPKEVDILVVLTEVPGEVFSKRDLMDRVWPDSAVEESNLSRHIYRLRKAFQDHGAPKTLIETLPRRGYRLAAPVKFVSPPNAMNGRAPNAIRMFAKPFEPQRAWLLPLAVTLVLVAAALSVGLVLRSGASDNELVGSLAVYPFRELSDDVPKGLGLGIADALDASLGRMDGLRVLPSAATSGMNGEGADPAAVGRDLGVDAVLLGSIQSSGDKVRVSMRLIRSSDSAQMWDHSFENTAADLFALQENAAARIANALAEHLNLTRREHVLKRYTENTAAYQAYLQGRHFSVYGSQAEAVREFERALTIDPKYAPAHAGLAMSLALLANRSAMPERDRLYEKARLAALQAIAIEPDIGESHAALGWIRRSYDWDWESAEKHLRRAVELDPNSARNHQWLAYHLITLGRTKEAIQHSENASRLDPIGHSVGWAAFCDRDYERSIAEYSRRLESARSPEQRIEARTGLVMALLESARADEALAIINDTQAEEAAGFQFRVLQTIAYARRGDAAAAETELARLEADADAAAGRWVRLAWAYAALGRDDAAIRSLENGFATRDDRLLWLKTTPYFDTLAEDQRFRSMLVRLGV